MAGVRTKPQSNRKFVGWYTDFHGRQKFFAGTTNREETLRMARDFEDDHSKIRRGYLPVPDPSRKHRTRPFSEVVDEYLAWGRSQGGRGGRPWAAQHARLRKERLGWWVERLGLTTLSDLEHILPRAEEALRGLQNDGLAGKTLVNYAEALKGLCAWCVTRSYLADHPVKPLGNFDTTPEKTRRALTPEEFAKLTEIAPTYRRLLYEVAVVSGLRRGELRQLSVDDLDVKGQTLRLHAEWTKGRREGLQPLSEGLVKRLAAFAKTGEALDRYRRAFAKCPERIERVPERPLLYVPMDIAHEMAKDMTTANVAKKAFGGVIDFQALRVTHVTMAFEVGASVKEAQTLARHMTPNLTLNTYGRARENRLHEIAERIGALVTTKPNAADNAVFRTKQAAGAEGLDVNSIRTPTSAHTRLVGEAGVEPARPVRARGF